MVWHNTINKSMNIPDESLEWNPSLFDIFVILLWINQINLTTMGTDNTFLKLFADVSRSMWREMVSPDSQCICELLMGSKRQKVGEMT